MGNLNMANVQVGFLNQIFFPQQTERGLQDAILFKANMALFCIQFQIAIVSVGKKFLLRCICRYHHSLFLLPLKRSQFKLILRQAHMAMVLYVIIFFNSETIKFYNFEASKVISIPENHFCC